jgi:hypothetical protein
MTTLVLDRVERRPRDGTSASLAGGDGDDSTIAENFRREGFFPPGTPTDAFPRLRVVRRGSSEEEDDVREDVFVSFFLFPFDSSAAAAFFFLVSSRSNASRLVSRASPAPSVASLALSSPSSMKSSVLDPGPLESSDIFSMLTIPCFALLS